MLSLEEVIKETLGRLIIYRCRDHAQFYSTIKDINTLLRSYSARDCPYKLVVVDSISAFYWSQRIEETHGISARDVVGALLDIIAHGRVISVFVGWKGGKDSIKFQNAVRITLDFLRFHESELISQMLVSPSDLPPFFLRVSANGCSFSSEYI